MFTARRLVSFAYWLEERENYKTIKRWTNEILNGKNSLKKVYFDFFMIFLVLSTVAILIYEAKNKAPQWLYAYETIAVVIFIFEWLGRLWTCTSVHKEIIKYHEKRLSLAMPFELSKILKVIIIKKLRFIFSFMSIIDLLAILPYYRPLRVLRFFMLFRIFKLMRYTNSIGSIFSIFKEKKFELMILLILSVFSVFIASSIMYIFEGLGDNPNLNTFFDAIYWTSVTMSTLGYGDITPTTIEGRIVSIFLIVIGLTLVVFATSIVTSAFTEKLALLRENKIKEEVKRIKDCVVILGYGRIGVSLAKQLRAIKQRFIVIDKDEKKIKDARAKRYLTYQGDVADFEDIEKLVLSKNISAIAVLTDNDATNLSVLLGIKAVRKDLQVIVRANDKENIPKYKIAHADHVIFPNKFMAQKAVEYINSPAVFDAIDSIFMERGGIKMDEIEVPSSSSWINQSLSNLNPSAYRLTLIGAFRKDDKKMIFKPKQDEFILAAHDILVVVGFSEQIEALNHKLRKI